MRKCPKCEGVIQDDAIKCKFCKELIVDTGSSIKASDGMFLASGCLVFIIGVVILCGSLYSYFNTNYLLNQTGGHVQIVGHSFPWVGVIIGLAIMILGSSAFASNKK